ncbi:cobalt-precorrin-6A reductase [Sphingomonas sp. PB2P12]|uniref:cobalt-precorrin-6A reductase n=1 Tax=Sphingomonas sandaracina TaxID=3096157 RepID=UPI002FC66B63
MPSILILGGTTEASALASALGARGITAVLSYAGRVANPKPQPVPVRIGGFGGVDGLAAYLRRNRITHLVDATHPFAAQMTRHSLAAAAQAGVAHLAFTRPAWAPEDGDTWQSVGDIDAAVAALAGPRRRVMLALGRMQVDAFAAQPQHRYLLRFVDQPDRAIGLPDHHVVVDRGPFTVARDLTLMREQSIDVVVSKNAGGSGAVAKVIAARALALPVLMIERPVLPARTEVCAVEEVLRWLGHDADLGV